MAQSDYETSFEEAYLNRFRGRSKACREALLKLDHKAETAIGSPSAFKAFLRRYEEAGTTLDARDARFYAIHLELQHRWPQAQAWYEALDTFGNEKLLRKFYIRRGLTTAAVERFSLTREEFSKIIDGNLKRLAGEKRYDHRVVHETLKACILGEQTSFLHVLLAQCTREAQYQAFTHVLKIIGRDPTAEEMHELGLALIQRRLMETHTYSFIRRLPALNLASTYIDTLIDRAGDQPDLVLGHALGLNYSLTIEQLDALYAKVRARLAAQFDAIHPNRWMPVVVELAERSPPHQVLLPAAYDTARRQTLRRCETGQAAMYAELEGRPLRLFELHAQDHALSDPRRIGHTGTKTFARNALLERIDEMLDAEMLDELD